ncbi:hypothetical protein AAE478_010203 [Parahypoxylon ruwenzoriense]
MRVVRLIRTLSTGELIGEGGVHTLESSSYGWPEIGYKFRKEFWGQGYGTEFLRVFLEAWWRLPRTSARIQVCSSSVHGQGEGKAIEQVYANADAQNVPSQKLLEKVGFTRFMEWTEPDTQEHRLGEPVTLVGYRLSRAVIQH